MALLTFFAMVIPIHKLLWSTITVASVPITGFTHSYSYWDVNTLGTRSVAVLLFSDPFTDKLHSKLWRGQEAQKRAGLSFVGSLPSQASVFSVQHHHQKGTRAHSLPYLSCFRKCSVVDFAMLPARFMITKAFRNIWRIVMPDFLNYPIRSPDVSEAFV